jgi:hypothetical protein
VWDSGNLGWAVQVGATWLRRVGITSHGRTVVLVGHSTPTSIGTIVALVGRWESHVLLLIVIRRCEVSWSTTTALGLVAATAGAMTTVVAHVTMSRSLRVASQVLTRLLMVHGVLGYRRLLQVALWRRWVSIATT